jgi:hypothetical protein
MVYGLERDIEDVDEVFILGTTHHIIALKLFSKSLFTVKLLLPHRDRLN